METHTEQSISPQAYFPATRPRIPRKARTYSFVNIRTFCTFLYLIARPVHLYTLAGGASAYCALLPGLSTRAPPVPLIFAAQ